MVNISKLTSDRTNDINQISSIIVEFLVKFKATLIIFCIHVVDGEAQEKYHNI